MLLCKTGHGLPREAKKISTETWTDVAIEMWKGMKYESNTKYESISRSNSNQNSNFEIQKKYQNGIIHRKLKVPTYVMFL